MKWFQPALLLALSAVVLTACGDDATPEPTAAPSATATAPSPSPSPTPSLFAALTGEPTTDETVLERPTLAVKIENSSASRPQSGLEVADVVYEELVEGGITRFIALFQSEVPDVVGPVRSGRLVDALVLPAYRPLMALSGAREDVIATLKRANLATIYDDGQNRVFYREKSRRAPHNLFSTGAALYEAGGDRAEAALPAGTFDADVPAGNDACNAGASGCTGPVAEDFTVTMSGVSRSGWEYDAVAGVYRRSQDGAPFTVTGEGRVGAANVVVLGMRVGPGGCCDPSGNPFTETTVIGEGRAIVLRDGRWFEVTWRKTAPGTHVELLDAVGAPFALKPGPTWVHLAPTGGLPAVPSVPVG